ncbi:MAG: hypothetical protein GY941_07740 [Planctomycetes bacterium]|nr:hypothetical protein [Planctomycetota bacterium]
MFDLLLQIWGGIFYLLNKIFFSRAERSNSEQLKRSWRIRSWLVYLAGLPAWVIVFTSEHNWIAASVESGGAPAMLVGLIIAWKGHGKEPKWLDYLARFSVLIGLILSFYEVGGLKTLNQFLELGIASGFLMGTYMLAKDNAYGYFWLILGNVSCAGLMGIEGFIILMVQQLVSLIFVTDAYLARKKTHIEPYRQVEQQS